jgi:hypothetical protein
MRVPRNTHLSFIRSVRSDFPRHVSVSVEPVLVESAPEPVLQVKAKSVGRIPVIKRAKAPVVSEPVEAVPEPVEAVPEPVEAVVEQPVIPAPPVKKTRKRKSS